jgi:hypothetical protein
MKTKISNKGYICLLAILLGIFTALYIFEEWNIIGSVKHSIQLFVYM